MSGYNYDQFSPDDCDFINSKGPKIGQKAPNFELETVAGNKRKINEFKGDYLVLELGSITCPLFHQTMFLLTQW